MNEYTEEHFPRPSEDHLERCYWRRVGLAIFIAIALAAIFGPLYGCATEKTEKKPTNDPKVCYLKLLGQTEEGYTVVVQQCVTTEEFQAAQK